MFVFVIIDKEPSEGIVLAEEKFSKRVLYKPDKEISSQQCIPTLF